MTTTQEEQNHDVPDEQHQAVATTHSKRRRRILLLIFVVIILVVITLAAVLTTDKKEDSEYEPNPEYLNTLNERGINTSSTDSAVEEAIGALVNHFEASCSAGISVGVTRNNSRIFVSRGVLSLDNATRKVTRDTLFEIGSVSKPLTGLVLANEIAQGNLELDTPLNQFLPDSVPDLIINGNLVTFRQLVTHTAGLPRLSRNVMEQPRDDGIKGPNPYAGFDEADMLREITIASEELSQTGESLYSNFGFSMLGYLLGKSKNSTFPKMQKELTDRLGMNNTWIELPQHARQNLSVGYVDGDRVPYWFDGGLFIDGAGSSLSSAQDLLTLVETLMSPEEKGQDQTLIEALKLSLEPLFQHPDSDLRGIAFAWEYGGGPRWWSHTGSTAGFNTYLAFQPESRTGVVTISNCGRNYESFTLGSALTSKLLVTENEV